MSTTYDWYKLVNRDEFLATGLVSKELTLDLEGIGEKQVVVFSGEGISIRYDDVYLICDFNGARLYEVEGYASYIDLTGQVWLGLPHAL